MEGTMSNIAEGVSPMSNIAEGMSPMSNIAVSLFSGLGGSSKALRDLGFEVHAHDFMPEAVQTLRANGFFATQCDVRDVEWGKRYARLSVDLVEGGPPCQPFSQGHDGDGRYDPRDMIPEFIRAVAELLPRLFVMEEVPTLTWKRHADYLARVEDDLRTIGYRVEHRVLNAADYGIPQARKRLFVIGVREDIAQEREWIIEQVLKARGAVNPDYAPIMWPEKSDERVTMAEALGWTEGDCWVRNQQSPEAARVAPLDGRHAWPMERPSTTVVGSFRPEVQAAPGYRKAGDGPRQNTKGSVVTTLQERLILQDMPADWIVCGSPAKQALQVGNSVPCGLVRELIDINA